MKRLALLQLCLLLGLISPAHADSPSAGASQEGEFRVVLGHGQIQMIGTGPNDCKEIEFQTWTENRVSAQGTVVYPKEIPTWTHWSVYFKAVNPTNGTATVCIDSGAGHTGPIKSEYVNWIVFGN